MLNYLHILVGLGHYRLGLTDIESSVLKGMFDGSAYLHGPDTKM